MVMKAIFAISCNIIKYENVKQKVFMAREKV